MKYDPILQPILIGNLKIKNRIYMPAMHMGMASNFQVTDQLTNFYAERSKGEAGLICVGFATVDELSGNSQNIGAHDDKFIPGLSKLAQAISSNGSKSAVQLNHAGRYSMSLLMNGKLPVAPSPIASRLTKEIPKELSEQEILNIINSFAMAALRVKKAGFDAVEILSGTGYLISEFLSPLTNKRKDKYGGSLKNRMRFGLDVIKAVRSSIGKTFPLIVRMNGNDFMPYGNGRKELELYAEEIDNGSTDALCINVGWHEARVPQIISSVPPGIFAYLSNRIKRKVNIPIIASHRINSPDIARQLLDDNMCDMVAIGRGLIADPMLPKKILHNQEDSIVHCTGCAQGCFDNLFKLKHVECLCNPQAGHETKWPTTKSINHKKIMIVGGGPAGINAALGAYSRGHEVSLHEKTKELGGQLLISGIPTGRKDFLRLASDLNKKIKSKKINIRLNEKVTKSILKEINPDKVILATGAKPYFPTIPGIELDNVTGAWDVLKNNSHTGNRIVIIGGGALGVETAIFLANKGTLSPEATKFLLINNAEPLEILYEMATKGTKQITLVEMLPHVGLNIGKSTRWSMIQDLNKLGVKTITNSKVKQITNDSIMLNNEGYKKTIKADTVIIATGVISYNPLQHILEKMGIPFEVVGDANQIATSFEAVHDGYKAGISS